MWASNEEVAMTKKYRIIDNITTLYVFIMTFVVSFKLSLAQNNDVNLSGENLLIFLCGFWGSVICIVIRYVFLYGNAISQSNKIKKILMLIYLTVGSGLFVLVLVGVLFLSHFSIKHDVLANYNAFQIFMLVILLSQWIGEKLLENSMNSNRSN